MKDKKIIINIVDCNSKDRPVLEWKGFGKVPDTALPLADVWFNKKYDCNHKVSLENRQIPVRIDNSYRKELEYAYLRNHDCSIEFSGVIEKIAKNKIMFDRLLFWDNSVYYDVVEDYMEEHVWVDVDIKQLPKDVHIGDTISFTGVIYLYRRMNGTLDYGVGNFEYLSKVENRVVPSKEKLEKEHRDSALYNLVCETCLFYEKCDLMFCLNPDYRNERFIALKTACIIQKIKNREELCYDDWEHLQIKPDKIEDFRLLITEYCDFGLPDYVTRFVECFIKEKSDWAKYMQDNGYV